MNKNEKLLAARQKLKEFQLNKQYHEGFHTHQSERDNNSKEQELERNIVNYNKSVKNQEKSSDNYETSSNLIQIVDPAKVDPSKYLEEIVIGENLSETNEKSEPLDTAFSTLKSLPSNYPLSNDTEFLLPSLGNSVKFSNNQTCSGTDISQNSLSNEFNLSSKQALDAIIDNKNTTDLLDVNCDSESDNYKSSEDVTTLKELYIQFNQSQNKISDLENFALSQNNELNNKFIEEINCLKKQTHMYLETTNILITEKANLNESISHYQSLIEKKNQTIEALNHEFNSSESRCSELQKNLLHMQRIVGEIEKSHEVLHLNYKNLDRKCLELEKCNEEQKLEVAELQQSLNLKNIDLKRLSQEVQESNRLLVLAELKLQQVTNKSQNTHLLEDQKESHATFEEQSLRLHEHLESFNAEKSEIINYYENYVKELITKCEGMSKDLQKSQIIIDNFKEREENMDKQHHQEEQKIELISPQETNETQEEYFTEKMNSLLQTQESLINTLSEKEMEIEILKKEITELHEVKNPSIEISKLASALESEQLGASRAISQNQQLKEQLSELQNTIITLNNTKLHLTQQLNNQLEINEELNSQLRSLISKNDQLQHELNEKIAVIDQMKIKTTQSNSEAYQKNSQSRSNHLINLSEQSETILDLKKACDCTNQESNFYDKAPPIIADMDLNIQNIKSIESDNNFSSTIEKVIENFEESSKTQTQTIDMITEPKRKLEVRFKEMMEKVAELTDEKQRLEHLVLQLQGETETIGEYITLYHRQRSTLQRKAQETEKTFRHLIEQYNQQHTQLHQLKVLLTDLMKANDTSSASNHSNTEVPDFHDKNKSDAISEKLQSDQLDQLMLHKKSETTEKIIDLMKDIVDCQDPCTMEQNFHPCLWCSGKLITV